jgi:hypothetical protein
MALVKWFTPKVSVTSTHTYFYLEWLEGNRPSCLEWRSEKPTDCNICHTVNLRGAFPITIVGKVRRGQPPFMDVDQLTKKRDYVEYSNASFLKSHLQKAVRRQMVDLAVRSAFHLMRLDMVGFCRRFVIIALEDSGLHMDLALLIWWMIAYPVASKLLCRIHVQYILGLVRIVTGDSRIDRIALHHSETPASVIKQWLRIEPNTRRSTLLYSLLVRRCYGGMRCDMEMLSVSCETLEQRGRDHPDRRVSPVRITDYLHPSEMLIPAYDFHVAPSCLTRIQTKHPEYSTSLIKEAIWICSSSCNTRSKRVTTNPQVKKIWDSIRTEHNRLARCYIEHAL